jgi:hypothetical protein
MTRKGAAITLSLNETDKASLQAIALQYGLTWGDKPNISGLVEAIAQGKYKVVSNSDWSPDLIEVIDKARKALLEIGEIKSAKMIAQLLIQRSELPPSLFVVLQDLLGFQSPAWMLKLDRCISQKKCFQLSFADHVTGIVHDFSIYYAEIIVVDKIQNLFCWCKEIKGKSQLPHNWSFRFDQIAEACISEITEGRWKKLESIDLTFKLHGSTALAYLQHSQDSWNDWCPNNSGVRLVVRSITDIPKTFAELRGYGGDCEIVAPADLAREYYGEIDQMLDRGKRFNTGYAPEF